MTLLSSLPTNFSAVSIEIKTPEELLKAQEELEAIKRKVDELVGKLQGYADQLQKLQTVNISVGGKIKEKIVKSTVDPLCKFNCFNFELPIIQISILINLYLLALKLPVLPAIPDPLKLLIGLQISIPIELPTIIDFKQYVLQKIEEAKQKCQESLIAKQLADAEKEESPFSARVETEKQDQEDNEAGPPCVCTERGVTLEEALGKADDNLRYVQKCCGKKELKLFDTKQENGVFIVTVGV